MSIQYGRWNFDGIPVGRQQLERAAHLVGHIKLSSELSQMQAGATIAVGGHSTTVESGIENQPFHSPSGTICVWDGRLDNRDDLIASLGNRWSPKTEDVAIVAAAYDRWGTACLPKLLGDWAFALWDSRRRTLVLARDYMGLRPIYYACDRNGVSWSTLLNPLILEATASLTLNERYIAGWLAYFPEPDLTPFEEIRSVPPGSVVCVTPSQVDTRRYWSFDPAKRIQYRADSEYEDRFLHTFRQAVRRRLRSDAPILAELSGGMDSGSIVCMADKLIEEGESHAASFETVSYLDDSESTWNERPYVEAVERKRGRTGIHIDGTALKVLTTTAGKTFPETPGVLLRQTELAATIDAVVCARGARVLLSGLGGDEAMGGAPCPEPELADLLMQGSIRSFVRQSFAWALAQKRPLVHVWRDTACLFLPRILQPKAVRMPIPNWIQPDFLKRNAATMRSHERRVRLAGPRASFQACLSTLEGLQRQVSAHLDPGSFFEKRYPFLDRDLWEFVMAIPREQLLRPRERRSLMRRALSGVVPQEILCRRRKAHIARRLFVDLACERPSLYERSAMADLGIVDGTLFRAAIEAARHGKEPSALPFVRTLLLDAWLASLFAHTKCKTVDDRSDTISRVAPVLAGVEVRK